jgi:DNA recombination protein RmuC
VLVAGFGAVLWFLHTQQKPEEKKDDQSFIMLQNQLGEIARTLDVKLSESTKAMQSQFGESAKIVRDVTERLTRLDETNKQVVNFADQLKSLQDILKNPKQRGVLGEYYLETVLKNVLPPGTYKMQYPFKDGTIVDAVVIVDKRIIPVDSKFSLDNYNRILESPEGSPERKKYEGAFVSDLKLRIDETAKYVKPEEDTMDFAFMFIPSEAIYYDLLINRVGTLQDEARSLVAYAGEKRVIIVSPTSFLAYLQTVLQGLKNQKISEEAKQIIKNVFTLMKHLKAYDEYFKRMGKNLQNTVSSYNAAGRELGKVDKDVLKITGETSGIAPEFVEGSAVDVAETGSGEGKRLL